MPYIVPPVDDDADLLTGLRNRDNGAFEAIYRKYWKRLYDFASSKTGNRDVAEEIIQDLFVTIWEKGANLEISNLQHYLFRATRNRIIDFYKEKVHAELETIDPPAADDYPHFLNELEAEMQNAVAQLPEKTQQIFLLRLFEGKSARQISKQLKFPERTVEYHITQGLKTLRSHLKEYIAMLMVVFFGGTF